MIRDSFRPLVALALPVLWAAGVAACRRPGDEDLGLTHAVEAPVVLDKLDDPARLLGALGQRVAEADAKLGSRGLDLKHTLELGAGASGDLVEEVIHLDSDGKGAFHLVKELGHPRSLAAAPLREGANSPKEMLDPRAQGMEAVAMGRQLYVRPRYGRYIERRPEPGELDRLRALGEHVLHDDLELLAPFVQIEERGGGTVMGRRTRLLLLSRRASRAAIDDAGDDPRRAWRQHLTVSELRGEIELDAATGVPLRAKLDARYAMPRPKGEPLPVHLVLAQDTRAAQAVEAPPDAEPTPHRPRPTIERNQLLEGLAPAVGTQASGAHP